MLQGKNALVTGGSRGIGRAICLRLAAAGAVVGVNYVSNPAAAEETLATISENGGNGYLSRFNVADSGEVGEAVNEITEKHGSVDILVNNAGITRDGLVARMKDEDWNSVLDTNLKGCFLCTKAVLRGMMKKREGRIINISSVIGSLGNAGQVNYAAAKAGMIGLTKSMAREFASRGITVNAVAPGYIVTDMTSDLPEDIKETIKSQIPLGMLGKPEDVAGAVLYLASPDGVYVTGQVLHINGGMYMGS